MPCENYSLRFQEKNLNLTANLNLQISGLCTIPIELVQLPAHVPSFQEEVSIWTAQLVEIWRSDDQISVQVQNVLLESDIVLFWINKYIQIPGFNNHEHDILL